ncbi:MAG TPA: Hsp20/alpha crystallin family protein [Atribacteraceae bacterium]|nr:Hsp20/alpha crystallin family protein [Atribacteraceae bacterium]
MGDEGARLNAADPFRSDFIRYQEHAADNWYSGPEFYEQTWKPFCDVFETEETYVIVVEIAGVSSRDLDVVIQGRRVLVRGCRQDSSTLPKKDFYQMEISFGLFSREVELPDEIDQAAVKTHFRDGLLVVECPKRRTVMEKRVNVE